MPKKLVQPDWVIPCSQKDSPETVLYKAAHVIPSPRQLAWQQLELTAFIHFGVNTFTNLEWGTGLEDPQIFNPTLLDAHQWVSVLAEAGFKQVILTAKHHDGFCLWPSRYTDFSVKNSPWQAGKGDVLREVVNAAAKFDLKVGVYLSPADLHEMEAPHGRYGNGSPKTERTIPTLGPGDDRQPDKIFTFTADDYNQYYLNQLYELLTEYGPIHEVWFDGANPKPGVKETYNYDNWFELVRALAPQAVMFNGPDIRWVGNEIGTGRETEWSVLPFQGDPKSGVRSLDPLVNDLGSRDRLLTDLETQRWSYLAWSPAEVDVSIRPGWFYHPEEDGKVKSLAHLLDIYYESVGRNCVLLLNIPPDRRGLFADPDVQRIREFGLALKQTFNIDLAKNAQVSSSSCAEGYLTNSVIDNNHDTCWLPDKDDDQPVLTLSFKNPITFDHVILQESLSIGQRVERFRIEAWIDREWIKVAEGTTIGYKRILHVPITHSTGIRFHILQSRQVPGIARAALHLAQ